MCNPNPVERYPNLFKCLGNLDGDYSIQLGVNPYALTLPSRVAIMVLKPVKEELARMITLGVISPVKELTAWCAGMVVVLTLTGVSAGRGIQSLLLSSHWHNMWKHKCSLHFMLTLDYGKSHWTSKAYSSQDLLYLLAGIVSTGCHLTSHLLHSTFSDECPTSLLASTESSV